MPYESVVLSVMPKTFNCANTCVSGASWDTFQRRYPEKTFEGFWEFCYHYQSIHSYPLRFFMTMNDSSKIVVLDSKAREAPLVKEELPNEEDVNHCFVYDLSKSRGRRYVDGSCIELPSHESCVF
jgi:hypothetical protein